MAARTIFEDFVAVVDRCCANSDFLRAGAVFKGIVSNSCCNRNIDAVSASASIEGVFANGSSNWEVDGRNTGASIEGILTNIGRATKVQCEWRGESVKRIVVDSRQGCRQLDVCNGRQAVERILTNGLGLDLELDITIRGLEPTEASQMGAVMLMSVVFSVKMYPTLTQSLKM